MFDDCKSGPRLRPCWSLAAHMITLRNSALASWSIALFEYLLQVPANRIGHTTLSLGQLKILQEVISLSVFVPFTLLYMKESLSWNYLYAAFCIAGAVFFIFRG